MQFAPGMLPVCMRVAGNLMETAMEKLLNSFSYVLRREGRIEFGRILTKTPC